MKPNNFLSALLAILSALVCNAAQAQAKPDFKYPDNVKTTALADIKKAEGSGDKMLLLDAVIRYTLAESMTSTDNAPKVFDTIEKYRKQESAPEYAALYALLEAKAYSAYCENAYVRQAQQHDTLPQDVSEWTYLDFSAKIKQLYREALSYKDALAKTPIERFSKVISYDKQSVKYYPTLLDFCHIAMFDSPFLRDEPLSADDFNQWLSFHKDEIAPQIFIKIAQAEVMSEIRDDADYGISLYKQYSEFEESGFILTGLVPKNDDNYPIFLDYIERFPNSPFVPNVKNIISDIEAKRISATYSHYASSKSKIEVKLSYNNVNNCKIQVYRYADDSYNAKKKLVKTISLNFAGKVPFSGDTTIYIEPLSYGIYSIEPHIGDKTESKRDDLSYEKLYISDIQPLVVSSFSTVIPDMVYAVDAFTGKPVEGATLYRDKVRVGTSDANGMVKLLNYHSAYENYQFRKGNDIYSPQFSHRFSIAPSGRESIEIFTDLAIYRPGETVNFALLYTATDQSGSKPLAGKKIDVRITDPNHKEVTALNGLVTDADGRLNGSFVIPTDRMNGRFLIKAVSENNYNNYHSFEVSEYKAPTFEITFTDAQNSYLRNEDVKISGKIVTYAGMPMANSSIISRLTQAPWYRRTAPDDGVPPLHQDTITTDANGAFSITLPAKLFDESAKNRFIFSSYFLSIACTGKTGETQEASHRFFIGKHRSIIVNNATFVNDAPVKLNVSIESSDPADRDFTCHYTLAKAADSTKVVAQGSFSSTDTRVDFTKVRSGRYTLTVSDASGLAEKSQCEIVLYRESDKLIPVEASLWMPDCGRKVNDKNQAVITLGTSLDVAYVHYIITTGSKVLDEGWKQYTKGMHRFVFDMPTTENAEVKFQFSTMRESQWHHEQFSLISPVHKREMRLEAVSFRDKIASGSHERWTFRLVDNYGNPMAGNAILALTDKAINSIKPNLLSISPIRLYIPDFISSQHLGNNISSDYWRASLLREFSMSESRLNTYGINFFSSTRRRYGMMRATAVSANGISVITESKAADNATLKESAVEEECLDTGVSDYNVAKSEVGAALDKVALRESEVKTALWLPDIKTEPDGSFSMEFDAPNINTTWLLQTIAYNANMLTTRFSRDVVSSKPIMVKANLPRFLRSGDSVTLAADLANKTDETVLYSAVIELFDPRTLEVKASKKYTDSIAPMTNVALTIDYDVPANIEFLGIRVKAATQDFGDGEQMMVPVLSLSQPVTESMPFFIDAQSTDFTAQLPKFDKDARITLEYCDNPLWYCATALPTIFDKDARTSTQLAHSLYALAIAEGMAKRTPKLADAIAYWKAQPKQQSALTSMLEKNADLKIGTLLASPWINEAERETLRMNSLDRLFDKDENAKAKENIIKRLADLQMSDGGFAWIKYNQCKSSLYCTGTVLELIGEIQQLGFLTDDSRVNEMVDKAIKYYDREYLKFFSKLKLGKKASFAGYADYVYVRQLHKQHSVPAANQKYYKRIVDDIAKHWGDGTTYSKAYYAIILNREGRKNDARRITESIRQFGITTPARGMYWDTPDRTSRFGNDQVSYTANVLLALNEVDRRTDEIDQIRKWILLNKQTNDWGNSSRASQAVYAILSTGSEWLTEGNAPTITVGGKPVELTDVDRYLGYARKEIAITDASNAKVEISRADGTSPAWGAIYSQYAAPITQIGEQKVDDLSITKQILVYDAEGKLTKARDLKVGDKVRIELTVKCGKNMEYITLNDQRGACFEPVDKVSTYDYQHGCCMYREIKDFATNIFIPYLSKGTYVLNYDCYVTNSGSFGIGIATIQCQYAPQFVAHSAGNSVIVK